MSSTSSYTFDVSRAYIEDLHESQLTDGEKEKILGWIRSRSIEKLAACKSEFPNAYSTRERARTFMQIEAFFKKNSSLIEDDRVTDKALETFWVAEKQCRITNKRLDHYYVHRDRLGQDMNFMIERAVSYIDRILGPFDSFMEEIPKRIRFTSGATATSSRRKSAPHRKVRLKMHSTAQSAPYLDALGQFLGYGNIKVVPAEWNRVVIVPKNWETGRTIACEQMGSLPLQLAFDSFCKERLRRKAGIDLRDQSRNQRLAKEGSISNNLVTVDVKTASDTIAYNTVAWLFPQPWLEYLDSCRASLGKLDRALDPSETQFKYAKFSSMGNGATFAIETLIFAACCYAAGASEYTVYGDDIIINQDAYSKFLKLSAFFGFKINVSKTHVTGPFRESCGGNYYNGVDITPIYLRDVDSRKAQQCHNVNILARIAVPGRRLWSYLLNQVEQEKLPIVPVNDNTQSGVHVDVTTAYQTKVLVSRKGLLRFKGYKSKNRSKYVGDSRCIFLWYLDKYQKSEPSISLRLGARHRVHSLSTILSLTHLEDTGTLIRTISRGWAETGIVQRSREPFVDHRMVREWLHWQPASEMVANAHVHWWSDDILRRKAE